MTTHKEVEIKAKPIIWELDQFDYTESVYGFHISYDPLGGDYSACWGEGDAESFDNLEDAKQWCQDTIDAYIAKVAIIEPNTVTISTAEYEQMKADAERFRWLTDDHANRDIRAKCREILNRLGVMSYSAACMAIDQAKESA